MFTLVRVHQRRVGLIMPLIICVRIGERKVSSEINARVCTDMDSFGLNLTSTTLSNFNRDIFRVGD